LHGFIVLRSQEGQQLATGEMIQTVEGESVTSEIVLHFSDGSIYGEGDGIFTEVQFSPPR
jgi:hypothetical protein